MLHGIKAIIAVGVIAVLLTAIGLGTRYLGLWGETRIQRKVFEESYQRSEGLKAQIANDEAMLAEIDAQLENPELDKTTRANLEAQARATRIRLRTARAQQN
jgi:hypothetical protein